MSEPLHPLRGLGAPLTRFQYSQRAFSSFVWDIILCLYVGWCIDQIVRRWGLGEGDDMPEMQDAAFWGILIGGPIVALLYSALMPSLGQGIAQMIVVRPDATLPTLGQRCLRFLGSFVFFGGPASGTLLLPADRLSPQQRPIYRSILENPRFYAGAVIGVLTFIVGWMWSEIAPGGLIDTRNLDRMARFVQGFFDPNWEIIGITLEKVIETIYFALMATLFAVPVSVLFSFFAARNIMPRTPLGNLAYYSSRIFFTFVRSTEPIVWAIIFCAWIGLGPFAGCLALFVHSLAALVKLYSEAIENIDNGPVEALRAAGAGPIATVIRAVLPQVVPPFVAFTMYRWDINVRMATILGFVGAGGIGLLLQQHTSLLNWDSVAVIILCITAVVLAMDLASARIRERIL